jgi:hypothetical protein
VSLTRVKEYQVDTSVTGITDPVMILNQDQQNANQSDIGIVMDRGTSGNVGFIWNEINNLFRLIYTSDTGNEQLPAVTITNNAPIMTGVQFVSTGNFSVEGDAKAGVYMQRNTTIGTALTQLFSDGASQNLIVSPNSVWTYEMVISAKRIDAGSDAASFKVTGAIARNTALSSVYLLGFPSTTVVGRTDSGWQVFVSADTATGALAIKVKGSLGKTVRWVAKVMTLEVSYNN